MLALAGSSVPGYVVAARSAAPVLALRRSRQPPATCFFNFGKADDDDDDEDTSQAQVKRTVRRCEPAVGPPRRLCSARG